MQNRALKILGGIGLLVLLIAAVPVPRTYSTQEAVNLLARFNDAVISLRSPGGISSTTKFGFNRDLDQSADEIIASWGPTELPILASAEYLYFASTDNSDRAEGTGATSFFTTCITETGVSSTFITTASGTNNAVSPYKCLFVNRAVVLTSGGDRQNNGTISITTSSTGTQLGEIPAGESTTQQPIFKVPSNQKCYIDRLRLNSIKLSGGGQPEIDYDFLVYSATQDTLYDVRDEFTDTAVNPTVVLEDFKAQPLLPGEIFGIRASTDTDNAIVSVSYKLICEDI